MGRGYGWLVSPCMDICDYGKAGQCRGCGMTEEEKRAFKRAPQQAQAAFIGELLDRFDNAAQRETFITAYRSKCGRGGSRAGALSLEALDQALAARKEPA